MSPRDRHFDLFKDHTLVKHFLLRAYLKRFLERATLVADVASTYPQVFVGHGMTADFIDQLQLVLDQIRSAGDAHDHHKGRQMAATASLKSAAKYACDVVGLLDALLTPALKDDPALFANWTASKRLPEATVDQPAPRE